VLELLVSKGVNGGFACVDESFDATALDGRREFGINDESALLDILKTIEETFDTLATDEFKGVDDSVTLPSTPELSNPVSKPNVGISVGLGDGTLVGIILVDSGNFVVVFTPNMVMILLLLPEVGMKSGCTPGLDVGETVGIKLAIPPIPETDNLEVFSEVVVLGKTIELFPTDSKLDEFNNVGERVGVD
jgi:hypothetical protein